MNVRGKRLSVALVAVLASCSSTPDENGARPPGPVEDSCGCTLSSGELAEREKWLATFAPGIESATPLADGFEVRFTGTSDWAKRVFQLIEKERSCCSSLVFEVRLEPELGPIVLRCHGPKETTDLLGKLLVPSTKSASTK